MKGRDVAIIFLGTFYNLTVLYKVFSYPGKKYLWKITSHRHWYSLNLIWILWFNPLVCQKSWKIGATFCSQLTCFYKHFVDYCSFAFNHLPKNRGSTHFMPILWKIYICCYNNLSTLFEKANYDFFFFREITEKVFEKKLFETTPTCLQWFVFTYKWFWNGKFQILQHKNSQVQNYASFKSYLSYKAYKVGIIQPILYFQFHK